MGDAALDGCLTAGNLSLTGGENGTEVFSDGEVKGHTLKTVKATETTLEHYKCSKCGKIFADKAGTEEVSLADVTIGAGAQNQQTIIIVAIVAGVLILGGVFYYSQIEDK